MKKRILSIFLTLCMLLTLVPAAAFAEEATVDIRMSLRAIDAEGNEISGTLDVLVNLENWINNVDEPKTYTCNVGENVLSGWDYCPVGYLKPTEDIVFNADAQGNVTLVSGNAEVKVEDGVTYFVIPLEKTETVDVHMALRVQDTDGNPVDGCSVSVNGVADITGEPEAFTLNADMEYSLGLHVPDSHAYPSGESSFIVDTDGNVTVTSESITAVTENGVTYLVLTLVPAATIQVALRPVDADGNVIDGYLDVLINGVAWIGTEPVEYRCAVGENVFSGWDACPEGFARPTEDIVFTVDADGTVEIVSGNATLEVEDGVNYFVVPLQPDHEHTYLEGYYHVEEEGHYNACDFCGYYDEASFEAHIDDDEDIYCDLCNTLMPHEHIYEDGWYVSEEEVHYKQCDFCNYYDPDAGEAHTDADGDIFCDVCWYWMPHEHTYLYGNYQRDEYGHYNACDICGDYDEASPEDHMDADSDDVCDVCVLFIGNYQLTVSNSAGLQLSDFHTVLHGDVLTAVYSDTVEYRWLAFDYTVPGEGGMTLLSATPAYTVKPEDFVNTDGTLYLAVYNPYTNEMIVSREFYVVDPIYEHPYSAEVSLGETAQFYVEMWDGEWSYKWQYSIDGGSSWYAVKSFEGKNADTLYVPVTAARDGFLYRCVLTSPNDVTLVTDAAQLSVNPKNSIDLTGQPNFGETAEGTVAPISVIADGEGLTYKWQYSLDGGRSWYASKTFEGKNTDTLYVPVTAARDGFMYRCVITDANGYTVISDVAELSVH